MKLEYAIIGVLLFGFVSFAQTQELLQPQKVIILSLKFEKNILLVEDSLIQYGSPPNRLPKENSLIFKIIFDRKVLDEYEIGDPRLVYDVGYIENISFTVVLPYRRTANKIEVFDKNQSIGSIDISDNFSVFCGAKNNICDLDCKEDVDCPVDVSDSPKPAADYSYLLLFAAVLLAIVIFYGYRKVKEMQILKEVRRAKRR